MAGNNDYIYLLILIIIVELVCVYNLVLDNQTFGP